LINTVK